MSDVPLRVGWLTNSPGPNTADFYDALSEQPGIDLTVFYCSRHHVKWHGDDHCGTPHRKRILFNLNPWPASRPVLHTNPAAALVAASARFDAFVVVGCAYPTAVLAMLVRTLTGRSFAVWGEMINRSQSEFRRTVQRHSVHALVRRAKAVYTMGPSGHASYEAIGVHPDRIRPLPYSCRLAPYFGVVHPVGERRHRVVTLSQLIPRKRVGDLIRAFQAVANEFPDWDLDIGGTGPQQADLQQLVRLDLRERVRFCGFVPKERQPAFYRGGDLFVLASELDGWGMVIPEAMAAGLPTITTTGVESAHLLIRSDCGRLIPPRDTRAIEAALRLYMSNAELRSKASTAARLAAAAFDAWPVAVHAAALLRELTETRTP